MERKVMDPKYCFEETFDDTTGYYTRSDILTGPDKGKSPFMRSFPALMDIGVMGHCEHGKTGLCAKSGVQCYQSGMTEEQPNMTLENYERLMAEAEAGNCFQVALGGRGDPDMHQDFEAILAASRVHGVVPNFTTSGLGMTREKAKLCKKYCGAVAVSWYSRLRRFTLVVPTSIKGDRDYQYFETVKKTQRDKSTVYEADYFLCEGGYTPKISWVETNRSVEYAVIDGVTCSVFKGESLMLMDGYELLDVFYEGSPYTVQAAQTLIDEGVLTNVHFVIGKNSLSEAMMRLRLNLFPAGINAIVFLLHKPVGQGQEENVLSMKEARPFFRLVDIYKGPFQIGFDSCSVPGLLNVCNSIDGRSLDSCEGARYSMYITSDMKALPCSFDNQEMRWAFDLEGHTIQDAWDSDPFERFRDHQRNSCPNCPNQEDCMGGCPIRPQVVLCDKKKEV